MTALVDMYPSIFRKKNRRETLILLVSILSYLVGLVMLTEVLWAQSTGVVLDRTECDLVGGEVCTGAESLLLSPILLPRACRRLPCPPHAIRVLPASPSLVPVTVLIILLPRLIAGALDSLGYGYKFIFTQTKPLQL